MARTLSNFLAFGWLFGILHTLLWLVEFYTIFWIQAKIKLLLRLIKRGDQALITISTILKFLALSSYHRQIKLSRLFISIIWRVLGGRGGEALEPSLSGSVKSMGFRGFWAPKGAPPWKEKNLSFSPLDNFLIMKD